jgi:hypothetical protein
MLTTYLPYPKYSYVGRVCNPPVAGRFEMVILTTLVRDH